jgi:hypothetical protein
VFETATYNVASNSAFSCGYRMMILSLWCEQVSWVLSGVQITTACPCGCTIDRRH